MLSTEQEEKPFFMPRKTEFLKYADWKYYEVTPSVTKLKNFLLDYSKDEKEIEKILLLINSDIQMSTRFSFGISEELSEVTKSISIPPEEKDKLINLIINLQNNTRMWANCGYTPNEISKLKK